MDNSSVIFSRDNIQVQDPLSEHDIIALHDLLLMPGIHELVVDNIERGRLLLRPFLSTIDYFHNIACLTAKNENLSGPVTHIYETFSQAYEYNGCQFNDEFLLDNFFYDFLWIELDGALLQEAWVPLFMQKLVLLRMIKDVPVILFRYRFS